VRRSARAALAMAVSSAALALAVAAPAAGGVAGRGQGSAQGSGLPVSLAITSISPGYVTPGTPVLVSGSVTNTSGAPISGLTVQLRSSRTPIANRDGLQLYADGVTVGDSPVPGAATTITATLAPHATATWQIPLRAGQLHVTDFGVYPLAAEADNAAGAALVTSRTFLPFWPGKRALDPAAQEIAWIWPLIGQPQQSACPGLRTKSLAASLAAGGRLAGLLAAGRAYAARAQLTWAIDPALLASAQTMTAPYRVGGTATCTGQRTRPASQAARAWLTGVRSATAGQPVFVTPFADVDVAALSHRGLNDDLASAFRLGRATASEILHRNFRPAPGGSASGGSPGQLTGLAWPADGIANYGVLNSLAVSGITTVVLDSATMPPSPSQNFTPSAVTTTPSGVGPRMHVLLSDDTITRVLAVADHGAAPPGTSFAVAQRFLAETAMIAAERPGLARSVVVAPPRRWDPPAGLAGHLLAETVTAPWLRPVSLQHLVAAGPGEGQVNRELLQVTSSAELDRGLLARARQLDRSAALLQGIRLRPDPELSPAILAAESSAWRGGRARKARGLLGRISGYLSSQQRSVVIIGPERVTLGGLSGTLPVSISNGLRYPVRVRLAVTVPGGGRLAVDVPPGPVVVPARSDVTLKLHVRAAAVGSATIRLSLDTPAGAPLPGPPVSLTVQATHFGTLALVIISAALGVFVLTSVRRAIIRGPGDRPEPSAGGAEPGGADSPDQPGLAGGADNVVNDHGDDEERPEEPDEYASPPGRTERR
jgi:uncharacterized protein DUF6049